MAKITEKGFKKIEYTDIADVPKAINDNIDNVESIIDDLEKPTFEEATNRSNIVSGETISVLFGKIKKFFTDLKTVAFTGSYTDLSNKPTSMQNPNSLTLTMNGSATSYNGSATASKSWYAPTSVGTAGYNLISNGSGAPVWQQPPYAVCSTSGNTAVKTVSISNFKLTTGVRVLVKFTYEHTSSTAATLNVNSTGAKNIVVHCGTDNIFVKDYFSWLAGETVELVYDGSYWVAIASDMRFITGAQSATVVIGTTKTQGFCDFRCDGTNDAECFNKAIRRIKTILSRNPPEEGSMMWRYGGTILVKTGHSICNTCGGIIRRQRSVFKNIARLHSADFNGGFSLCRCRNRNDYNCTRPQNQKNRSKRIKTDKIGIAVHCGNDTFGRSRTDLLDVRIERDNRRQCVTAQQF